MSDFYEQELANLIVRHSLDLQKGQTCLINAIDVPVSMVEALVRAVYAAGAYPQVDMSSIRVERALLESASDESLVFWADCDAYRMRKMDAYIGIRGIVNPRETSRLGESYTRYLRLYNETVHMRIRVPHTKWVVLRYPTDLMAYQAGMPIGDFENYFYQVTIGVDYAAMARAMEKAKQFMEQVDRVHIIGVGTDLEFSIAGMPAIPCAGRHNIPDGELYSAPLRQSVQGTITYNTSSTNSGHCFTGISFTIRDGKIIEATADDSALLNMILDTDEGARYFGEFSLGCNPHITFPMDNTLFDEKIAGSLHFTPGNAYENCDNGNRSAVHWDLVQIQTPKYGGGEIWMDGSLIRKDGIFVHEAFEKLNG